jgi:hypothetical protein
MTTIDGVITSKREKEPRRSFPSADSWDGARMINHLFARIAYEKSFSARQYELS